MELLDALELHRNMLDFVYSDDDNTYLTLKPLEKYVTQWETLDPERSNTIREQHRAKLDELLHLAEMLVQENLRVNNRYDTVWSLSPECALLIQLRHEALRDAWGSIYKTLTIIS